MLLWDIESGNRLGAFLGHKETVNALDFSPDGRSVLSGSEDGTTRLWDVESMKEGRRFDGEKKAVSYVAFLPHSDRAISLDESGHKIRLLGLTSGKEIQTIKAPSDHGAISADGKYGLFAESGGLGSFELWDLTAGARLRTMSIEQKSNLIWCLCISRDNKQALTGDDRSVRQWDLATGNELRTFTGHTYAVISVAFSPDGRRALSGSMDASLILCAGRSASRGFFRAQRTCDQSSVLTRRKPGALGRQRRHPSLMAVTEMTKPV